MSKKKEAQPTLQSADDLIIKMEAEKLGKAIPEVPKAEAPEEKLQPQETEEAVSKPAEEEGVQEDETVSEEEVAEESQAQAEGDQSSEEASSEDVDEYGNKVGKPKLYTQEEVQQMIRDRLKRGSHAEKEVQEAAKDFAPNPDSDETWEVQLENFIEATIEKRDRKLREEQAREKETEWRKKEEQVQTDFEIKFTEGMTKYKDFNDVVQNKPITNAMMIATRTMKDPAAFVYAACKKYPKEIQRIAEIPDAVAQATEIGRLEERMRKARSVPSSPRPLKKIAGDATDAMPTQSIESRIQAHAKSKIMYRS